MKKQVLITSPHLVDIQIPFSDGNRYVKKTATVKRVTEKNIAVKLLW